MKLKIFLLLLFPLSNVIGSLSNELLLEKCFENRCKLIGCHYFRPATYNDKYFDSIDSFTNSKPNGYIARFSFYIAEPDPGNAIIVLSSQNTTDYYSIDAYTFGKERKIEFIIKTSTSTEVKYCLEISGLGHTLEISQWGKSLITKSDDRDHLPEAVLKVLIEITELGYLHVYFDDNPEPTVTVFDSNPIDVKFIALHQQYKPIQYFFNCPSDTNEIPTVVPNPTSALFDDNDLSSAPIHVLAEKCKVQECWDKSIRDFFPFNNFTNSQPSGYRLRLPFYMVEQARISLSRSFDSRGYRIEIDRNAQTAALSIQDGYSEKRVQVRSIPYLEGAQVRVLFQLSEAALIEVYLGDLYMPVFSYDNFLIDSNMLQFDCESRTLYFYECPDFGRSLEDHALLDNYKPTTKDRKKKCATLENLDNYFPEELNISAAGNVIEDGYIIRLPIYVQAEADVFILLTTDGAEDNRQTYEFNIGGDDNTITTIRKNNQVLGTVKITSILDKNEPVKIIIEITNAGIIRIFTQHNRWVPLLEAEDKSLIDKLSYISFYSYDQNALFFYKCITY